MRNVYVYFDNLSKMRVKFVVNILSEKVCWDMVLYKNNIIEKILEFIKMCEMFWNVFNDNSLL